MEDIRKFVTSAMLFRGYHYFEDGKVKDKKQIDESHYSFKVQGNSIEPYDVVIDTIHPTKSTCTCPYCQNKKRSVCKHKVAAMFCLDRNQYEKVKEQVLNNRIKRHKAIEEIELIYQNALEKEENIIKNYVDSLSEQEVRDLLFNKILESKSEFIRSEAEDDYARDYDPYFEDNDEFDEFYY